MPDPIPREIPVARTGKGCWYSTVSYVCVICGHTETYRQRETGPKPGNWHTRNVLQDTACDAHFL